MALNDMPVPELHVLTVAMCSPCTRTALKVNYSEQRFSEVTASQ